LAQFSSDLKILTVSGITWCEIVDSLSLVDLIYTANLVYFRKRLHMICSSLAGPGQDFGNLHGIPGDVVDILIQTLLVSGVTLDSNPEILSELSKSWRQAFTEWLFHGLPLEDTEAEASQVDESVLSTSINSLQHTRQELLPALEESAYGTAGRKVFITGPITQLGRCEPDLQTGDLVCVILGCAVPMILRPVDSHFEVIGEAWLYGIMKGEAMTALEQGKVDLREFELH